jgi:hypothetical protein
VPAAAAPAELFALEVFAAEGEESPAPPDDCDPAPERFDLADLPAGTRPLEVLLGGLPEGTTPQTKAQHLKNACLKVAVGSRTYDVYTDSATKISKLNMVRPGRNGYQGVKIVAVWDPESGGFYAESIDFRKSSKGERELVYVAEVDVTDDSGDTRTVEETGGSRTFSVDTSAAEIDPGLGSHVAIEFDTAAPVAD